MAQITIHLDEHTLTLMSLAAEAKGISQSQWVADIIRTHTEQAWPPACLDLAGRFPDFPLQDRP